MNLEPIDTSTTAGKARVMQLAAEGRKVAGGPKCGGSWQAIPSEDCFWNWHDVNYAIIAQQGGPDEVWCVVHGDGWTSMFDSQAEAERWGANHKVPVVRYRRVEE